MRKTNWLNVYRIHWSEGLFAIITSVVLICLFFLIGHSFGYILLIILLVLFISLMVAYWMRRPAILFGFRPSTSVKFPNYALHVIPAQQLINNNNNMDMKATNSGFYVYPHPTNVNPPPVYTTERKTVSFEWQHRIKNCLIVWLFRY